MLPLLMLNSWFKCTPFCAEGGCPAAQLQSVDLLDTAIENDSMPVRSVSGGGIPVRSVSGGGQALRSISGGHSAAVLEPLQVNKLEHEATHSYSDVNPQSDLQACTLHPKLAELASAEQPNVAGSEDIQRPEDTDGDEEYALVWEGTLDLEEHSFLPFSFEVDISHTSALGLGVDTVDEELLIVTRISEGPVQEWNLSCEPDQIVRTHDRIKLVNGVKGKGTDLVQRIKDSFGEVLTLTFQRPHEVVKPVLKMPGITGLSVSFSIASSSIVINAISSGAAIDWNESHPANPILLKDRIVAVNGEQGLASYLSELLKNPKAEQLELTIVRYREKPQTMNLPSRQKAGINVSSWSSLMND
eukprot:TRINITY_DN53865_c0_g1_i1.p1 TRINITY_DN53865_c0_g1~~TRINITY_DN53865_c0_g1_i1.p1  ORF type:complete len:358 (-),score=51.76 TRINITY_DN53865_c0_g1_i1:160-1233(-)